MSVRLKAALAVVAGLAIGLVSLYFLSRQALEPSYGRLEERFVRTDIERSIEALQTRREALSKTNHDWSAWDDTYEYVQSGSADYVESNLSNAALSNIGVHVMAFVGADGQLLYAKMLDAAFENQVDAPDDLVAHLAPGSLLVTHDSAGSVVSGILSLEQEPMLISARPIVNSAEDGPIAGTMLMGVRIDDGFVEQLAATTRLSLAVVTTSVSQPGAGGAAVDLDSPAAGIEVVPVTDDLVEGRTVLLDIYGQPVANLTIALDRSIRAEGQRTLLYLFWLIGVLGAALGILLLVLIDRSVLRRVSRLASEVQACGEAQDFSGRVSEDGNDEVSNLARSINDTIEALSQTHAKLRSSHSDLEQTTLDLKRTEQELRTTANQLGRLTRHLQSVREEERALVAGELHDHIGQTLTTLKMDLATLSKTLARGAVPSNDTLQGMSQLLDSLMETVKRLSVGLYPSILGDLGLTEAMEWQLAEFGRQKSIHTSLAVRGDPAAIDSSRALVLYRILQECLAEMAGHSAATEVTAMLTVESRYVLLSVADNGKPLPIDDPHSSRAVALGLIKDRAEVLGGGVTITSDETGTAVVANLPL